MKIEGKPRRKRKSIIMTMRYTLDIHEDDPEEAKAIGKLFKTWMRDKFSQWDDTILQHFLYENNLVQNKDDDRFILDGHLEKIVKDDCSDSDEREEFDSTLIDYDLDQDAEFDFDTLIKDTSSSEMREDEEIPTKGEENFDDYYVQS